jgi:hypothetical protein
MLERALAEGENGGLKLARDESHGRSVAGSAAAVGAAVSSCLRDPTPLPKQLVYVPGTGRVNLGVLGRPPDGLAI